MGKHKLKLYVFICVQRNLGNGLKPAPFLPTWPTTCSLGLIRDIRPRWLPFKGVLAWLAELDLVVAKGAQVRARCQWAEEGEPSSSFFLRQEKKHGADSWIPAVRTDSGEVVTDLERILTSWRSFYSCLSSAEEVDLAVQKSLLSSLSATLSSGSSDLCEGPLSLSEVHDALKGMSTNKSSGSDGLPPDFHLKCWSIIRQDLVDVFNFASEVSHLSSSQRLGQISLLFKKGDRLDRRNWRPITLLNADYKLCARALGGRLLQVLQDIVHPEQTCGVPGRFIGENVALLRDVVAYPGDVGCPAAILSLDQEKAVDRVNWPFLFALLTRRVRSHPFVGSV